MSIKQIVILANSVKHHSRCIAGKEVVQTVNGWTFRDWIRPVSDENGGAIGKEIRLLSDNKEPRVLDIVNISIERHVNDRLQPENWLTGKGHWSLVDRLSETQLSCLQDDPEDLWLDPWLRSDRISTHVLDRVPPKNSLCLVEVSNLEISFSWQHYDPGKRRRRATFQFKGQRYDVPMTDPTLERQILPRYPAPGAVANFKSELDTNFVCMSLGSNYRGYHYKIAATVFI